MKASNAYLCIARSEFARFSCVLVLMLSSAVFGQSMVRSQESSGASLASNEIRDTDDRDDTSTQIVSKALGTPSAGQTETNPKPHLPKLPLWDHAKRPLNIEGDVDPPAEFRNGKLRSSVIDRSYIRENWDKNWRPLPLPNRFKPEAAGDEDEASTDPDADSQNGVSNKFHWKPAILQSLLIQSVQHAYAITIQPRMRRELKGPFFKDYFRSVKNLRGWEDGNRFFTNYVAHPMQGAMTGFIFLQNHDRLKRQKFAESKTYWVDRLKAMAWSAAWSTQWEIGPFSQASIGNVGLYKGMAYVDLVITPTVGTAWMIVEEALDRYVIRHLEKKTNFFVKMFLRTLLNPMRGVANTLRFQEPWKRDRPFGT